jgi:hypothetical protein
MHYQQFINSLADPLPPANLNIYLQSLWLDAKNDWSGAHDLINDLSDPQSAWIHAYLHRKEGDLGNAGYWYNRAGKKPSTLPLEQEWQSLVMAFTAP